MNDNKQEIFQIDEITWNDLDLEEIAAMIDTAQSSVGSEYIRKTLHTPSFSQELLKRRSKKISFFQKEGKAAESLSRIYKSLGRTKKVSFLDYIFKLKEVPEKSNGLHILLILLLLASIALLFILPAFGIIALVVMIAVNIIVYFKIKAGIEGYFICLKYLVSMVVCAQKILSSRVLDKEIFSEELNSLQSSVKAFAGLKSGSWLITNSVSGSLVDVIMDYIRMILHVDLMKFNSMRKTAVEQEAQIGILYDSLGEIELSICAAGFREKQRYYCEPVFYNATEAKQKNALTLVAEEVFHPLTKEPVPNSIKLEGSLLLTGANASGKSTFLKTIAINQLFAQTIYTCLSRQFITTFYKILSSMALSDNILGKESYFIVEIKSLKRIFDELGSIPVMGFIDEVLRGTNTIERISASSRILEDLAGKNTMLFAATHDIELTVLLDHCMTNCHFTESVKDGQVCFDYKLKDGAANSSNAIKLLEAFGFDKSITDAAKERSRYFKETGLWK